MAKNNPIYEIKNLNMHFTGGGWRKKTTVKAVDDISFDIREGETFGLVGESGCGKTTTGRILARLYDPISGSVKLMGKEITGKIDNALRHFIASNVAMIFQDPIDSLNPRMTIEEIIAEGLRARGEHNKAVLRDKVISVLGKVGLSKEHASRYPHEFSGGQRQRIGIARAIIVEPRVIIADEPVSALDVSIQAQVINLLNDLKKELGLTILFIAHNLSIVQYFSDRIGVMYYGKLVEIADSGDLYRNPIHPYTRVLLSAIPRPNPITERTRKRLSYNPAKAHDYSMEQPSMREVEDGHFVYCSESEYTAILRDMQK